MIYLKTQKMKIKSTLILLLTLTMGLLSAQEQAKEKKELSPAQIYYTQQALTYQAAVRYNDYDVAKQALYNLYVANPQNDSILYSLSVLYVQSQQYPSAILTAKDILTLKPDHVGAMEIAGVSYENLGLKDKALENYESLYLKTDDYQTLYKIAFLQNDLQRYAEALTNVDILLGKKETEEANAVFPTEDNKEKEYPIKVALLNLKGLVKKAQGDKTAAKALFDEALKLAPDFVLAKNNLAELNK